MSACLTHTNAIKDTCAHAPESSVRRAYAESKREGERIRCNWVQECRESESQRDRETQGCLDASHHECVGKTNLRFETLRVGVNVLELLGLSFDEQGGVFCDALRSVD